MKNNPSYPHMDFLCLLVCKNIKVGATLETLVNLSVLKVVTFSFLEDI